MKKSMAIACGVIGGLNGMAYMAIDVLNETLFSFWRPQTRRTQIAKIAVTGAIGVAVKTALGIHGYALFGIPAIGGIVASLAIRKGFAAIEPIVNRIIINRAYKKGMADAEQRRQKMLATCRAYPALFKGEVHRINGEYMMFNGWDFVPVR